MDISVCICTCNSNKLFEQALQSLTACEIPAGAEWELLLLNNTPGDDAGNVAERFRHLLPVRYIEEPKPGKSHALNTALSQARGVLVVFADDDVQVTPGWIAAYWQAWLESKGRRYFGGKIVSQHRGYEPDPALLAVSMGSIRGIDFGPVARPVSGSDTFIGSNWAAPLAALLDVGGFDPTLGLNWGSRHVKVGEETHIMQRLTAAGLEAWYVPGAEILHDVPKHKCTIGHVLQRSFAWGYFDERTAVEAGNSTRDNGVPRWMYRTWFELAASIATSRLLTGKAYRQRIRLAELKGRMAALRDVQRA